MLRNVPLPIHQALHDAKDEQFHSTVLSGAKGHVRLHTVRDFEKQPLQYGALYH